MSLDQSKNNNLNASTANNSNEVIIPEADKISYPKTYLFYHVTLKGVQIGGFAGALTSPVYSYIKAYYKNQPFKPLLTSTLPKFIIRGTTIGFVLTALIAFRLYHNKMTNNWDKVWAISTVSGITLGAITRQSILNYGLYGHAFGMLAFIAYQTISNKI
ncbi:hypothetical protein ABK040_003736 [Willaertia magna]